MVTERRADADIGWLELLAGGNRLFVEIEEWVHKTSGRMSMRLIAQDENGEEIVEREWPWLFFPGVPLVEQLPEVFPWAGISVDDDHYRDEEYAQYVNECGIWDSEDKTYIYMRDFSDWYAERQERGLRPYGYAGGGEVALWRLELTLNELGKRTLARVHERDYIDALLAADAEATERNVRLDGYYRGSYGTVVMREVEVIDFLYGDDTETILGDDQLWTTDDGRIRTAAAILEHAMERESTQALAEAFAARFKSDFDDEGKGWVITHKEIRDWLHELGI